MRYLKLTLAYDGTDYCGWQVQPNGVTIQQRLEEAWRCVTSESIRILASGRTDSGVHALAQVCSLATTSNLDCHSLGRALNANLPDDIRVLAVQTAPTGFHAIRDASRKTYRYRIQHGPVRNPIGRRYCWFCYGSLQIEAMREAAGMLVGEHDFASFQAVGSERESTVRNLSQLGCREFLESGFNYLEIEMSSNGFLYNMVRNIVGTLAKVGQGSQPASWVDEVLRATDRTVAGPTAPARGLALVDVEYDGIEFGTS